MYRVLHWLSLPITHYQLNRDSFDWNVNDILMFDSHAQA